MRSGVRGLVVGVAVALGGCAYAPSGTVLEVLEASSTTYDTSTYGAAGQIGGQAADQSAGQNASQSASQSGIQSGIQSSGETAAASAQASAAASQGAAPPPSAYAAPAASPAAGGPPATGSQAAAANAARAPGALLSADEAAATRERLLGIARARGGAGGYRPSVSAGELKTLRETHGQAAIRDIEEAAAD